MIDIEDKIHVPKNWDVDFIRIVHTIDKKRCMNPLSETPCMFLKMFWKSSGIEVCETSYVCVLYSEILTEFDLINYPNYPIRCSFCKSAFNEKEKK